MFSGYRYRLYNGRDACYNREGRHFTGGFCVKSDEINICGADPQTSKSSSPIFQCSPYGVFANLLYVVPPFASHKCNKKASGSTDSPSRGANETLRVARLQNGIYLHLVGLGVRIPWPRPAIPRFNFLTQPRVWRISHIVYHQRGRLCTCAGYSKSSRQRRSNEERCRRYDGNYSGQSQ